MTSQKCVIMLTGGWVCQVPCPFWRWVSLVLSPFQGGEYVWGWVYPEGLSPGRTTYSPWEDHPQGLSTPWKKYPTLGRTTHPSPPPRKDYSRLKDNRIRSASGQCASYWNGVLFSLVLVSSSFSSHVSVAILGNNVNVS